MSAAPVSVDGREDEVLQAAAPAVWAALSPLGRRLRLPDNFLPHQTAEARGKPFNATIGQITDGRGGAVPLPPIARALGGLDAPARSRALLYSPVEGLGDLRRLWRERHPEGALASLPVITAGTVQALSLVADLFLVPGRPAVLAGRWPEGDAAIFSLRTGAHVLRSGPRPLEESLTGLPAGEPALIAVRLFDPAERQALARTLSDAAEGRPLVVVVDDSPEPPETVFWDLLGRHPGLVPLRVEAARGSPGAGSASSPCPSRRRTRPAGRSRTRSRSCCGRSWARPPRRAR